MVYWLCFLTLVMSFVALERHTRYMATKESKEFFVDAYKRARKQIDEIKDKNK